VAHEYEDDGIWALYAAEELYDEFLDACPRDEPTRDEVGTFVSTIALGFSGDLKQAASILREASDELELQALEDEGRDEHAET
jgi:hypothetical protein